jgi:hypothetical protein
MKRKWCENIAMQPVYVSEFVILLHLILELVFITFIIGKTHTTGIVDIQVVGL